MCKSWAPFIVQQIWYQQPQLYHTYLQDELAYFSCVEGGFDFTICTTWSAKIPVDMEIIISNLVRIYENESMKYTAVHVG